jgi:hypothetical protein
VENFEPGNQQSIADFVLRNISNHKQFTLATTDKNSLPWAVCLSLAIDKSCNVIWQSRAATEHSKHIAQQPEVAICIFSETDERGDLGLYARATACEVTDHQELAGLLKVRFEQRNQPIPPLDGYLAPAPYRLYYATLKELWVNDDRHIKTKVDLAVLRELAKQRQS